MRDLVLHQLVTKGRVGMIAFVAELNHAFLVARRDRAELPTLDAAVHLVRPTVWSADRFRAVSIGRMPTNDICIDDPSISRRHAVFERDPQTGDYTLWDRDSCNGTRIGGYRAASGRAYSLRPPCHVDFGGLRFFFYSPAQMFAVLLALSGGR